MIQLIASADRHHFETDWLSTYWHFSFDHYYDPANLSFGPLRVFNDDVVRPGGGFPMHPHREMEIVTYILEGTLEHRDSLGNVGRISPGEVQRMSAGTGIRHSEYNASKKEPVHLLQLWILPANDGLAPSWEQKPFSSKDRTSRLLPIAVPVEKAAGRGKDSAGLDHAVRIHQDATIYTSLLPAGKSLTHAVGEGRRAYLFMVGGELRVNGQALHPGDQARITGEKKLELSAGSAAADLLLLDLP